MTFGPGTTPGTTPGTSLLFGAPSSQPLGSDSNKIDFQFGGAGSGAGSSSFTFGQNSSVGSGFTFTAGTDKQPMNNPFAASQPSSQVSAPIFGGNSSTSTPSSSFNFTFGQQSSTLKAAPTPQANGLFGGASQANGTPSFSFSQPQPSQNVTSFMGNKAPGPMGIFGQLHAGGEASAGTASPFPAPSSMGTTPMNGTPEPEAGHEDGEEPRQTQISLTEGGPGEEDETIVHEVRAKAIKFIPVQPEDEDQDRKSPWSTQGVGSLRVLKNKQTGAVRMLLRAEPRGHVALNKTILSDVEYKAKDKTVNFVAAKDDGFGLETWVLQVKTAVFANELAKVLESNKISNKK
ncbi:hypothetical protein GGS21DRAFT_505046 [Xylaria nigripes]|nr:hypothetical protein GGS21DRAFT_505046 [Xylaria nigripes]